MKKRAVMVAAVSGLVLSAILIVWAAHSPRPLSEEWLSAGDAELEKANALLQGGADSDGRDQAGRRLDQAISAYLEAQRAGVGQEALWSSLSIAQTRLNDISPDRSALAAKRILAALIENPPQKGDPSYWRLVGRLSVMTMRSGETDEETGRILDAARLAFDHIDVSGDFRTGGFGAASLASFYNFQGARAKDPNEADRYYQKADELYGAMASAVDFSFPGRIEAYYVSRIDSLTERAQASNERRNHWLTEQKLLLEEMEAQTGHAAPPLSWARYYAQKDDPVSFVREIVKIADAVPDIHGKILELARCAPGGAAGFLGNPDPAALLALEAAAISLDPAQKEQFLAGAKKAIIRVSSDNRWVLAGRLAAMERKPEDLAAALDAIIARRGGEQAAHYETATALWYILRSEEEEEIMTDPALLPVMRIMERARSQSGE